MRVDFPLERLAEPETARSAAAIRACVHCGFCSATCPTYVLLGDELDSPRGRIVLIKEMLETEAPPTKEVVQHIDRCLTCLACTTTCPSGVDYSRLIDHARGHIEKTYARPFGDRLRRSFLAAALASPPAFRLLMLAARAAQPFSALAPKGAAAWLKLAPKRIDAPDFGPRTIPARGPRRGRIGLLEGCVQRVVGRRINAAAIRFFTRRGFDVVRFPAVECCGALAQHLGKEHSAKRQMKRTIDAWNAEAAALDAIAVTTSGCGTTVNDYGVIFESDPALRDAAKKVSALARDVTELIDLDWFKGAAPQNLRVAYHPACSLQHGQKIRDRPKQLLKAAGYEVLDITESHLCCGSAGVYNLLQPAIAAELGSRKAINIAATKPDAVASGNLGCLTQIAAHLSVPAVHTIELLDWASGGPRPAAFDKGNRS